MNHGYFVYCRAPPVLHFERQIDAVKQLRLPLREALCIKLPMRLVLVTSILMNACWQLESRQTTIRLAVLVANASCLVRNRRQL